MRAWRELWRDRIRQLDATDAERASWAGRADAWNRFYGQLLGLGAAAANLLFWPTDLFALDPEVQPLVSRLRLGLIAIALLAFATVTWVRAASRGTWAWVLVFVAAATAWAGSHAAAYGGVERPWFYASYAVVPLTVPLLTAVGRRVLATATLALTWTGAFFLTRPAALDAGDALSALVFLVFVAAFTVVVGHAFHHLARSNHLQHLRLEAQALAIARERERSEGLLLNILPPAIAERLKAGDKPIADAHDQVSVLFADIVGFTPLAQRRSAAEVVALVDRIFSRFDGLADRLGVEKIKTIGDAYMVAAGLPEACDDHAVRAAEMGLGMLAIVRELAPALDETGPGLGVRVGIHSGPVVAGVIGTRKFAYDLWGDTVNTASRMESHGVAGAVQISEATRALLGDGFALEPRGEIEVKGKGPMAVWLLRG